MCENESSNATLPSLYYSLTSYKEIATNNENHSNRRQNKSSPVSVVFVANEADSTNRVSVDLWGVQQRL